MLSKKLPRAEPSLKNVDAAQIIAFLDYIKKENLELHSFMLFRSGAVVAEGFWKPYGPDRPHMQHSAAKSWTATAIGLAIAEGLINLDDRVVSFFPDLTPNDVSPYLAAMTVRDLLTMRTGHRTGISGGEWRQVTTSWTAAFLNEPVVEAPGSEFIYSSATSYMLSAILTRVTGLTAHAYLTPRLFEPLRMGAISWDISPEGVNPGGNGISCVTEDVLKFGVLHLQKGEWEGERILPADWVKDATRNQVKDVWMAELDGKRFLPRPDGNISPSQRREGYGYQWWMTAHGGYRASGVYGQQCIVLPNHDAVIAITAAIAPKDQRLFPGLWNHLLPSLGTSRLQMDRAKSADAALRKRLEQLSLEHLVERTRSNIEASIDGLRYAIADNPNQVREIGVSFEDDLCRFVLVDHRGTHVIDAGMGREVEGETSMTGNSLHHQYQPDKLRVVASAAWSDDDTLKMTWRFVETAFCDSITLRFDGDKVAMDRSVNVNSGDLQWPTLQGRAKSA